MQMQMRMRIVLLGMCMCMAQKKLDNELDSGYIPDAVAAT